MFARNENSFSNIFRSALVRKTVDQKILNSTLYSDMKNNLYLKLVTNFISD